MLISVKQLAEDLGVPVSTIYRWNYLGTGPRKIRIGRYVRFCPSEVERWLKVQSVDK